MYSVMFHRRWAKSRNTTIAHAPVHSPISSMHLMSGYSLLASSIQYGVVSRSFPLTGKVLSGFLDASGTRVGMGIGNPNTEFTPNVSACAIASDGGTARILWGFRNGEVAVMTAPRTMDAGRRTSAELVRCNVNEQHEGAVLDVAWDDGSGAIVFTAGADGRVKVWDAKRVRCVWTSEAKLKGLVPDPCMKVVVSISTGYVVGVLKSGEIVLWTGFDWQALESVSASSICEVLIPCPNLSLDDRNISYEDISHSVSSLHADSHAFYPTILVGYQNDPYFYRLRIAQNNNVDTASFGDAQFGPISTLAPFFSANSGFVLTGDCMGCISVYDWRTPAQSITYASSHIHPVRKFEANEDGAGVTALAWNGVTLITGSARGTTHIWDGLTFEHLRSFASPVPRMRGAHRDGGEREREAVSQILVGPEKEVLLVAVGDRVLAWRAGPVGRNGSGGVRNRHLPEGKVNRRTRERHTAAKYISKFLSLFLIYNLMFLVQLEMQETISESRTLLELQSEHVRRANGREREQLAILENMGLDEAGAVEYVLMLSRDEAVRGGGRYSTTNAEEDRATAVEEGVFEGDFDDVFTHLPPNLEPLGVTSSASSSSSSTRHGASTFHIRGRPIPQVNASKSNQKVQLSPPYRPEVMEAGLFMETDNTPATHLSSDESHFPPITSTNIGTGGDRRAGNGSKVSVLGPFCEGPSSSSSAGSASAWSTPLITSAISRDGSLSPSAGRGSASLPPPRWGPSSSHAAEMDGDLRYAIELSLAEARSRGEDV
jgi:WD40 repeat protein